MPQRLSALIALAENRGGVHGGGRQGVDSEDPSGGCQPSVGTRCTYSAQTYMQTINTVHIKTMK